MEKRASWLLIGALKIAYERGILRFIDDPNGPGTVCEIGGNWFYFAMCDCYTPSEMLRDEGLRCMLEWVYDALEGKGGMREVDPDEYGYYIAVLRESGCYKPLEWRTE